MDKIVRFYHALLQYPSQSPLSKGLLQTHYGLEHGEEIYELLLRTARGAASDGQAPGIVFGEDGGEFVRVELEG